MTSPQTFAQEFPHLTRLGKVLGRATLGIAASMIVIGVCALIGIGPFLCGWFGCTAFTLFLRGRP